MALTDDDVQEFAQIWEREFGERFNPNQARLEASKLLEIYLLLATSLSGPFKAPAAESSSIDP